LGSATGNIRLLLRVEGLSILIGSIFLYYHLNFSWEIFAWFFLAPDLALVAYLYGPRFGALTYNLTHSYAGAIAILLIGLYTSNATCQIAGIIWFAHIGFDRTLGYGLKYFTGFKYTHLGNIGKIGESNA